MSTTTRKTPILRQLLWAATLSMGFGAPWFVLALMIGDTILDIWPGPNVNWPPWEELVIKRDGTVLIRSVARSGAQGVTYRDLNGRAAPDPAPADVLDGIYAAGTAWTESSWLGERGWETLLNAFVDQEHPGMIWYFVHDGKPDGTGYFAGYDRSTRGQIGFIGGSGFRLDRPAPEESFPVRSAMLATIGSWSPRRLQDELHKWSIPSNWVYVPSGNRVRLVDLRTRTVRTAFQAAEPIEALAILEKAPGGQEQPPREVSIVVWTTRTINLLNRENEIVRTFNIPSEAERATNVTWYELGDGRALAEFYRPWRTEGGENIAPRVLYQIAADGTIRSRTELALQIGMPRFGKQRQAVLMSYAFPVPGILPFVNAFILLSINQARSSDAAALRAMLENFWPSLLALAALGLGLALLAWRRARVFGLSRREQVAWAIFVFVFGIPGYVGYLLYRRWPHRAECPHCHAQAPRDREACTACETPFPGPVLKGIEVFA